MTRPHTKYDGYIKIPLEVMADGVELKFWAFRDIGDASYGIEYHEPTNK